jgi:hypothetical protein
VRVTVTSAGVIITAKSGRRTLYAHAMATGQLSRL